MACSGHVREGHSCRHWKQGDTGGFSVRFNSNSRLHRIVSGCVVALLTANAFAIAMILTDDEPPGAESPARTLTLITTADGTRYLVDPNTDAGRAAIADAQRNGSTITQVTVPSSPSPAAASEDPSPDFTLPPNGILPIDPGSTLDDTLGTLLDTVSTVSSILGSTQSTASSILGSTQSTVSSILGSTESTVSSIVGSTQSTVANVVTTVTGVVSTVSSTVGGVVTTLTVPAPVSSLLSPLTSPTSTVTTTPTTVVSNPICTLLDC
jgi:hypothetical protein